MYPPNNGEHDLYIRQDLELKRPIKFMALVEAMHFLDTHKFPDGNLVRIPQSSYQRQVINGVIGYLPEILIGESGGAATIKIFVYHAGDGLYFDFDTRYQDKIHLVFQGSGYLGEGYNSNQIVSFVNECYYILNKALHPYS